jgi:hypothetical protein
LQNEILLIEDKNKNQGDNILNLKDRINKMEIDFDLKKEKLLKTMQTNMENLRKKMEIEHQEQVSKLKIKMNKTFEFNRNYLINKYTKEIEELKTTKGDC